MPASDGASSPPESVDVPASAGVPWLEEEQAASQSSRPELAAMAQQ
jgi:hypothetical protein